MSVRLKSLGMVVAGVLVGCEPPRERSASALLPVDATACSFETQFLEVPQSGGFIVNTEVRDSAGVARWLAEVLPRREKRLVQVRLDESRRSELAWLVPAIASAGGKAYTFDPSCRLELPTRAAS